VRPDARVEDLLRRLAPQVLGALVRRYGRFDACEDAVQEALLAAAVQWPAEGIPESPRGGLTTVAGRRLTDVLRSEQARRRREDTAAAEPPPGPAAGHDDTLARAPVGPYQVQAAIAAVHAEAPRAEDTDWRQVLALYRLLERISPNPMATLNHAVALAMVEGPQAGLELLATLDGDDRLAGHHRLDAVRAYLLEQAGDRAAARARYALAARRTTSLPEQRYLRARAERLTVM
jgi:predicted RNA polymerase sigma factor